MYNDILLTALRAITLPIGGHPNILCLGIFNGGESIFEGVIMDGTKMSNGPILKFTYDWDTDLFTEL